jgi:hypothetical protein
MASDEVLDNSILERVKADDHQPTARCQDRDRRVEGGLQCAELVVDGNSQRLKHPRGGMQPTASRPQGGFGGRQQVTGPREAPVLAPSDDQAG